MAKALQSPLFTSVVEQEIGRLEEHMKEFTGSALDADRCAADAAAWGRASLASRYRKDAVRDRETVAAYEAMRDALIKLL